MTINDFLNMDIITLRNYIEDKQRYDTWVDTIYNVTCDCVDVARKMNYENPRACMSGNRLVKDIAVDIIKDYTRRIKNGEIR